MKDYENYNAAFLKNEEFFNKRIMNSGDKAFEYGLVVVKNSILISGGGLLAVPTIATLSSGQDLDLVAAAWSGSLFALSIIIAIIGAYVIHLNWTLHTSSWMEHWEQRQEWLKRYYLEGEAVEQIELPGAPKIDRWINITYRIPHGLVLIYIGLLLGGYYKLFSAFVIGD